MLIASFGSLAQHGLATSSGTSNYTSLEEKNKALVLEAFDTLFNQRDYVAAERYWSPEYIQHSAHIAPGREGLFNLIKSNPPTLKYVPGTIVADGDFVIVHGRFSGLNQPVNWIAADIHSHRGWAPGRALGCDSGRGDPRAVKEWHAHVRGQVSKYKFLKIETMLPIGNFYTFIKPIVNMLMNLKESRKGIVGS